MKYLVGYMFVIILLTSCKKNIEHDPASSPQVNYQFNYHNFFPDTIIACPYHGYDSISIDVNNDSVFDFRLYTSSYTYWYGPHEYDAYQMNAFSLDTVRLKLIKYNSNCGFGPCQTSFDSTMYIYTNSTLQNYQCLLLNEHSASCNCYLQKKYIGFVYFENGNKYLGWIQIQIPNETHIIVDDYALDINPDDSIRIGQH